MPAFGTALVGRRSAIGSSERPLYVGLGSAIVLLVALHGHDRAAARNLHLHRAAFARLGERPELLPLCLRLVEKWLAEPSQPARPYLEEWRQMLSTWPLDRTAARVLEAESGQALRQCSPLGPTLSPQERWRLLEEVNRALEAAGSGGP